MNKAGFKFHVSVLFSAQPNCQLQSHHSRDDKWILTQHFSFSLSNSEIWTRQQNNLETKQNPFLHLWARLILVKVWKSRKWINEDMLWGQSNDGKVVKTQLTVSLSAEAASESLTINFNVWTLELERLEGWEEENNYCSEKGGRQGVKTQ